MSDTPLTEEEQAECKRRGQFLHDHKAPKDWIITTRAELEPLRLATKCITDLRQQLTSALAERDRAVAEAEGLRKSDMAIRVKLINLLHQYGTGETELKDGEKIDEMVQRIVGERDSLRTQLTAAQGMREAATLHEKRGVVLGKVYDRALAAIRDYDGKGHSCPFRPAIESIRDTIAAHCEAAALPSAVSAGEVKET